MTRHPNFIDHIRVSVASIRSCVIINAIIVIIINIAQFIIKIESSDSAEKKETIRPIGNLIIFCNFNRRAVGVFSRILLVFVVVHISFSLNIHIIFYQIKFTRQITEHKYASL